MNLTKLNYDAFKNGITNMLYLCSFNYYKAMKKDQKKKKIDENKIRV